MNEIYSKSSHGGRVSISFNADRNEISSVSCDYVFPTYPVSWELEDLGGTYRIKKTTFGMPPLRETAPRTVGVVPNTEELIELKADTRESAVAEMAEVIAHPYKEKRIGQFPVSYSVLKRRIREALEDAA